MKYSWKREKPSKTVAVIRYGAWGDCLQSISILPGLKRQGFHITFFCTPRGYDAIKHDPHVDEFIIQNEDIVPNSELMNYFNYLKTRFTKVINLCETVEGIVLPEASRAHFHWSKEARHFVCNRNYVEMQHKIAQVPYTRPETRFYMTEGERGWISRVRNLIEGPAICWSLSGSAVHKIWPHIDEAVCEILNNTNATIVFVGHEKEKDLQPIDFKTERVWKQAGIWNIRQAMSFAQVADIVVGPETGILNSVAMEPNRKVVLLSHSTVENLTRDWVNTISLAAEDAECYPCHRLQLEGWRWCNRHPEGTAVCQMLLKPERVVNAVLEGLVERLAA